MVFYVGHGKHTTLDGEEWYYRGVRGGVARRVIASRGLRALALGPPTRRCYQDPDVSNAPAKGPLAGC
eukprot:gene3715-8643_t